MGDVLHSNLAESAAISESTQAPRQLLFAGALILVTVIAYLPAIRAGFIWDDDWYVTGNLALRDWRGLATIWFDPPTQPVHHGQIPQYYPMTHTSFWLEYRLWGNRPMGYHITNILLHATNAVLAVIVLQKLAAPGAWLAGAIFALHPVHVESVAWVTERKNVLSTFFYLFSLLAYLPLLDDLARPRNSKRVLYATSLMLFVAALLSKSVTASLPAAILLIIYWKRRRIAPADFAPLIPFVIVGIAMGMVTSWIERHVVGAQGADWDFAPTLAGEFLYRSIIAGKAIWFYVGKLLWPSNLAFSYPRWEIDIGAVWQYIWPIAAVSVVISLFALRRRIGTGPLVAVLFFGGTLLPALGYFNVFPMRYSFVADHFQYLASLGLIALAAAMLTLAVRRLKFTEAKLLPLFLLFPLAVLTWRQTRIYDNLEILWRDTISKNPGSWLAHSNLGILLSGQGRIDESEPHLVQAWKLRNQAGTATHLGAIAEQRGNIPEAIRWHQRALALEPESPGALSVLGRLLGGADGRSMVERAIELDPANPSPHTQLGMMLENAGDFETAAAAYQRAMQLDTSHHTARTNFANLLLRIGEARDAAGHLLIVLADQPRNAAALNGMGVATAQMGDFTAAESYFRAALDARPNFAAAQQNLDRLLIGAATRTSQ